MKLRGRVSILALLCVPIAWGTTAVTVTSVSPQQTQAGDAVTVQITGVPPGLANVATVSLYSIGSTQTFPADSVTTVPGSSDRKINFHVPAGMGKANAYPATITILAGSGAILASSVPANLTINPDAALVGLAPAAGTVGTTVTVSISGAFTNFLPSNVTALSLNGSGVAVNTSSVADVNTIQAKLNISSGAPLGPQSLTVTLTGGKTLVLANAFTVMPKPARVSSISPSTCIPLQGVSTSYAVSGVGIGLTGGGSNGFSALGSRLGPLGQTSKGFLLDVACDTKAKGSTETLTLIVGTEYTVVNLAIQPPAGTVSVTPNQLTQGTATSVSFKCLTASATPCFPLPSLPLQIAISNGGSNNPSVTNVSADGSTVTALVTVPAATLSGSYAVSLSNGAQTVVNAGGLSILGGVPAISSVSPPGSSPGRTLNAVVSAKFFNFALPVTADFGPGITVNAAAITVTGSQATIPITVAANAATNTRQITVNSKGVALHANFTVADTTTLLSITPNTGVQGTIVPVTVASAGPPFATGTPFGITNGSVGADATAVTVAGNSLSGSLSLLTAGAKPDLLSTGPYLLSAGGPPSGLSLANAFFVTPLPRFLGMRSLAQGSSTTITLTGDFANFNATTVVTSSSPDVSVGAPQPISATQLSVPVTISPTADTTALYTLTASTTVGVPGGAIMETSFANIAATPGSATLGAAHLSTGPAPQTAFVFGTNTHFTQAKTRIVLTCPGFALTVPATVTSPTNLTFGVSLETGISASCKLQAVTLGEVAESLAALLIDTGSRTISTAPQTIAAGGSFTLTVPIDSVLNTAAGLSLGEGVSIQTVVHNGANLVLTGTVSPLATPGTRDLLITNQGVVERSLGALILTGNNASFSATPNAIPAGSTISLDLAGVRTNWTAGITQALSASNLTIDSLTVTGPASATVSVTAGAAAGPASFTMQTLGEMAPGSITLTSGTGITAIAPPSIPRGSLSTVTITGLNTNFTAATPVTATCGAVQNITLNSDGSLSASIDVPGTTVLGTCSVTAGSFSAKNFLLVGRGSPAIVSLSAVNAQQNSTATISLTTRDLAFDPSANTTLDLGAGLTLQFAGSSSETFSLSLAIPANTPAGVHGVTVTEGLRSAIGSLVIDAAPPTITNVSPLLLPRGQTVPVNVTGLNTKIAVTTPVSISPSCGSASVSAASPDGNSAVIAIQVSPTADVPSTCVLTIGSLPPRKLNVTRGAPVLLSIGPNLTAPGVTTMFTVTTRDLATVALDPVTVNIGALSVAASAPVIAASQETFTVPATIALAGSYDVSATQDGRAATLPKGLEISKSAISIAPALLPRGQVTTVTVTGAGVTFTAASKVDFACGVITSATLVDSATIRYRLSVNSAAAFGSTCTASFTPASGSAITSSDATVGRGAPTILSITPAAAALGANPALTIVTRDLMLDPFSSLPLQLEDSGVGALPAVFNNTGIPVITATQESVQILLGPIPFSTALGAHSVTISQGSRSAAASGAIVIDGISSVSQVAFARGAAPVPVTVTGEGFNTSTPFSLLTATNQSCGLATVSGGLPGNVQLMLTIPFNAPLTSCFLAAANVGSFPLTITRGTPKILDITPSTVLVPGFANFTIHTIDLLFAGGSSAPTVTMGGGPTVSAVHTNIPSDGSTETLTLTATFLSAAPGPQALSLSAGAATASLPNAYALNGIASLSQTQFARGAATATVTVSGFGFDTSKPFSLTNAANQSCGTVGPATGSPSQVQITIAIPQLTPLQNCSLNVPNAGSSNVSVVRGAPKILDVLPSTLPQNGNSVVTVHTVDLLAASPGVVTGSLGADVTATLAGMTISDPLETVILNAAVAGNAAIGPRAASITSGGLSATLPGGFSVSVGTAAITAIVPPSIPRAAKTTIAIGGVNAGFSAQSNVSASCGTVSNVHFTAVTASLTADVTVDSGQSLGACTVSVSTPAGPTLNAANLLTVVPGAPALLSLNPTQVPQGSTTAVQFSTRDFVLTGESIVASQASDMLFTVSSQTAASPGPEGLFLNVTANLTAALGSRQFTLTQGTRTLPFSLTVTPPLNVTFNPSNVARGKTTIVTATAAGNSLPIGAFQQSCGSPGALSQVDASSFTFVLTIAATVPLGDCPVRFNGFPAAHLTVSAGDPAILLVSPNSGTEGQTANLHISTRDLASDTTQPVTVTVDDYSATNASGIFVSSAQEDFPVALAVPPTALTGSRNITVTQGTRSATLAGGFVVSSVGTLNSTPSPAVLDVGFKQTIAVTAVGSHFSNLTVPAFDNPTLTISNLTVLSATSLQLDVSTPGTGASTGRTSLSLTTGGEVVRADLTVSPVAVSGVLPPAAPRGKTTVIAVSTVGFDFLATPPVLTVTDSSNSAAGIALGAIAVSGSNSFTVPITLDPAYPLALPAGQTPLTISIAVPGSTATLAAPGKLNATPGDATILSFSPGTLIAGASGIPVTITTRDVYTGQASGPAPNAPIDLGAGIAFGPAAMLDVQTTREVLTGTVDVSPSATGVHSVTIASPHAASLANAFTVNTAAITTVNPNTSPQKQATTVTFTVANLPLSAPVAVTFSDPRITVRTPTVNILSTTQVSAVVDIAGPAAIGTSDITISSTGNTTTKTAGFTVTAGNAVISAIDPVSIAQAVTIDVAVTGAGTSFEQGLTTATFGAGITVNSVTVQSQVSALVNISSDPGAANGFRTLTLATGGETASLANVFAVGVSSEVGNISPNAVGVGLTSTVRVTGSSLTGATFSFPLPSVLPAFCGQDTPPIACTAPTATVVSNDGNTAVLTVRGGTFAGDFALVITTNGVSTSSDITGSNRLSVVAVNTAFMPPIAMFNSLIDQTLLPALAPGTNAARSAAVAVYNQSIDQTLLPALPNGENNAFFPPVAGFGNLIDQTQLPALATGTNAARSASVSLFNGRIDQTQLPALADGTNQAFFPAFSLQNSASPPTSMTLQTVRPGVGATPEMSGLDRNVFSESSGAFAVYPGQTLQLKTNGANSAPADLQVNDVAVSRQTTDAIFTVPAGIEELKLQWQTPGFASPAARLRVLQETAAPYRAMLLNADGTPATDRAVTWSAGAFAAEVFSFRSPVTSLPDLSKLRPYRQFLATAINQPNPHSVFGADPLGLGTTIDVAVRYRTKLLAGRAGMYRFQLHSNGFVSLMLDSQRVAGEGDLWMVIPLEAGLHDLEVVYAKGVGPESLELTWLAPGMGVRPQPVSPYYVRTQIPGRTRTNAAGMLSLPAVPLALDTIWIETDRTSFPVERRRTGDPLAAFTLPDNSKSDNQ